MSKAFTADEWDRIEAMLWDDPNRFGLPPRQYGTVVFASFNIRKLGSADKRDPRTWRFLADVCRRFDLLAVQEVMEDLSGLRHLKELMGPDFAMIVSDPTGAFPGDRGLSERLAFIYNWRVIERTEVATDVSYDRTKVLETLADNLD